MKTKKKRMAQAVLLKSRLAHCLGWIKGFEPSTLGTTIRYSNQLSYIHHHCAGAVPAKRPCPCRRKTQLKNSNTPSSALQYFFIGNFYCKFMEFGGIYSNFIQITNTIPLFCAIMELTWGCAPHPIGLVFASFAHGRNESALLT